VIDRSHERLTMVGVKTVSRRPQCPKMVVAIETMVHVINHGCIRMHYSMGRSIHGLALRQETALPEQLDVAQPCVIAPDGTPASTALLCGVSRRESR